MGGIFEDYGSMLLKKRGGTMRKRSVYVGAVVVAALLYLMFGIAVIRQATRQVTDHYYKLLESKTLDIAKMAASLYTISDQEVAQLRQMTFEEALQHPANIRLSELFGRGDFSKDFKYAYIMVQLPPEEVKYYVTEETAAYYGMPAGTPLNLCWLVDAIINPEQQAEVAATPHYYDDIHRYSVMKETWRAVYDERRSQSIIAIDQYGEAFAGLVPMYSEEGHFVGMLGTDIYYEDFINNTNHIRRLLTLVFLLPTIFLTLIFIGSYVKKVRQSNISVNTDPMTGLYNRRYLERALRRMAKEGYTRKEPVSVLMIDIDCFKNYNDRYGHQKGDEAIVAIAHAIGSVLRAQSDVLCRYGGEELIALLPNSDVDSAVVVAERIRAAIAALHIPHESSLAAPYITVSQGIYSTIPQGTDESEYHAFVAQADAALYTAKHEGRDRYAVATAATSNCTR